MNQCFDCNYRICDKERDETIGCEVSKQFGNPYLLSLAGNGVCPYHCKREEWGGK
jgi:hypothetical protein